MQVIIANARSTCKIQSRSSIFGLSRQNAVQHGIPSPQWMIDSTSCICCRGSGRLVQEVAVPRFYLSDDKPRRPWATLKPAKAPLTTMFSTCRRSLLALTALLWLSGVCNALHFYLDADEQRCFIEEVPTDTVVEGPPAPGMRFDLRAVLTSYWLGHFRALEWAEKDQTYVVNHELGITVEVIVRAFSSASRPMADRALRPKTGSRTPTHRREISRARRGPLHLYLA